MNFKKILTIFWIKIEKPIWSFIINTLYWSTKLNKIKQTNEIKKGLVDKPLNDVMSQFIWIIDTYKDWTPWVMTVINNELADDCDGAAKLAWYWYKAHGTKATQVNLYTENMSIGHCICVRDDHTEFTSNNYIIPINDPVNWKEEIFKYFNNEYNTII